MGFLRFGPKSLLLKRPRERRFDPYSIKLGIARLGTALMLLMGCATPPALAQCPAPMHEGLPRPDIPRGLEVDPAFDTRDACPAWRWIGLREDISAPCPAPAGAEGVGWKVRPLFASSPGNTPAVLRPFCVYEMEAEPGDPPVEEHVFKSLNAHLEALISGGELNDVWSTCAAVAPMSDSLKAAGTSRDRDWRALRENFLAQAQQLRDGWQSIAGATLGDESISEPAEGSLPVRLAILDTQPSAIGGPGTSDHGYALAVMAQDLLYPCVIGADGGCERGDGPVTVGHRLALPIDAFDWADPTVSHINEEEGGYFGTVDQLAEAVWRELDAWPGRHESRLVLNLSLGWVGEYFGGKEDRVSHMPVPVQSLFRVLEIAACRDVLVIAATGNRVGGPDIESGPLMPAFWHQRRAPREHECRVLMGHSEGERPRNRSFRDKLADKLREGDRPLLYAVGGVRYEGSPLINARPASESSIAAYSDHSVVLATRGDRENPQLPSIFAGTSIGTTVVSTAAAAAWSVAPHWTRHQLMDELEASGQPLGRRADVYLRAPAEVQRVGVCPAFAWVLAKKTGSIFDCGSPPTPASLGTFEGATDFQLGLEQSERGLELCRVEGFSGNGGSVANPCPFHQFYGIRSRPWTGPQPVNNPCMGCDIRPPPPGFQAGGDWTLRLQIDSEWNGGWVSDPLLQLGKEAYRIDICRPKPSGSTCPERAVNGQEMCCSLAAGDVLTVGGIPESLVSLSDGSRPPAAIYFDTRAGSIESPVYISFEGSGAKQ